MSNTQLFIFKNITFFFTYFTQLIRTEYMLLVVENVSNQFLEGLECRCLPVVDNLVNLLVEQLKRRALTKGDYYGYTWNGSQQCESL